MSRIVEDLQTLINDPHYDGELLRKLRWQVFKRMLNGNWWTVQQMARVTGGTETSVSSCFRDLRKHKNGGWTVIRRRVDEHALSEYRLVLPEKTA